MELDPQAQALLALVYRAGVPRLHELTVEQARLSTQKTLRTFRPDPPAVASLADISIPRPGDAPLMARLYQPIKPGPAIFLPVLIYFHGGGWCLGDIESYDVLCRQLANFSGCAVLSVDYRLAPEHPFPAAIDDALLATDWVADNAKSLALDGQRIALGGDSAGGNLAIVTALRARDRGFPKLRQLTLIYPSTEIFSQRPSRIRFADGHFLDLETLNWFFERYLPAGNTEDWRASPMRAASLAGLPPMLMMTAGCDPLTDDCLAFTERVQASGGKVEHLSVPGMIHGFITLGKLFPQAETTLQAISRALTQTLDAG